MKQVAFRMDVLLMLAAGEIIAGLCRCIDHKQVTWCLLRPLHFAICSEIFRGEIKNLLLFQMFRPWEGPGSGEDTGNPEESKSTGEDGRASPQLSDQGNDFLHST